MELNEETLERILDRQEEKFEHRMGILVEGLRSDIQGVAEGVSLLREEVEVIKGDLTVLKTDMEVVKTELAIIRNDLKQKVGRDEFALLEARVALLERTGRSRL